MELADGRRETPVESWSAWAFSVQGLPPPVWQVTVLDEEGVFLGRTDAWWKEGVAGEADGRAKYRLGALERTGAVDAEGLARTLDDQRRRERELRQAGVVVVRWEPRDLLQPDRQRRLTAQLVRELGEVRRRPRFRGRSSCCEGTRARAMPPSDEEAATEVGRAARPRPGGETASGRRDRVRASRP